MKAGCRQAGVLLSTLVLLLSACKSQIALQGVLVEPAPGPTASPASPPVPVPVPTQTPVLPPAAAATAIFSDHFDDQADWSVPYTAANQGCNKETGCTDHPDGYYGYYISRSVVFPLTGHGLHLDSTNPRGPAGKSLTFWDQTDGTMNWTSGMQLGVDFPAQKEVYVRYWIRMQPGYRYYKGPSGSMLRKLNHISHYLYNGKPFTFFTAGGFLPTTINTIRFANAGGSSNLSNGLVIRPDPDYNGTQPSPMQLVHRGNASSAGVSNYFDLPNDGLPIGNYSGTGTEYNSPGMLADGGWHALEFYLRNNSAPGIADGGYRFWFDGVLQISADGLIYRQAGSTLPDAIWNFVHVGGNAYSPFLGDGISGEQWYAVDDLVISKHYSGPPPPPVNVSAVSTVAGTARVTWQAGSNGASPLLSGYRVRYGTLPGALSQIMVVDAQSLAATVSGLESGRQYFFEVTAVNRASYDYNENESIRSMPASVVVK